MPPASLARGCLTSEVMLGHGAVCLCWGSQGREAGLGAQVWLEAGGKWGWESQAPTPSQPCCPQVAKQQVKATAVNTLQHMGARVG